MEKRTAVSFVVAVSLAVSVLMTTNVVHASAEADYRAAVTVAENGFRDFLQRAFTAHAKTMYRLTPGESAQNAELGEPFRLRLILPNDVHRCQLKPCTSPDELAQTIDTFLFPIVFDGQIKLLMSVDRYHADGEFEIGSLGYRWLAGELSIVLQHWPRAEGYKPTLYKSNQAQVYGFSIPTTDEPNLTLIDPVDQRSVRYQQLTGLAETIDSLQLRIEESLRKGGLFK